MGPRGACTILMIAIAVMWLQPHGSATPALPGDDGDWATATNLGPVVNSAFDDIGPCLSKDRKSLFFASTRPGFGEEDIWVSHRNDPEDPWGLPMNLGSIVNSAANERTPSLSRDGHYLFFVSDRPGGYGGLDVWVTWRQHKDDDFGWEAPINLGATINSSQNDAGPSLFENDITGVPQLLFASNRPGMGAFDIYFSLFLGGSFQSAAPASGLNTAANDLSPHILKNGLEIFIASSRNGTLGFLDLWESRRETVDDEWNAPTNLGPAINTSFREWFPSLSSDSLHLHFASDRPGGFGGDDLYLSSRAAR